MRGRSGVVAGRCSKMLEWGRGKHGVGGHMDWRRLGGTSARGACRSVGTGRERDRGCKGVS